MPPRVPPSPTPGATRGRWCTVISLCSHLPTSKGCRPQVAKWDDRARTVRDGGTNLIAGTGHFPRRLWALVRSSGTSLPQQGPHPRVDPAPGSPSGWTPPPISAVRHHPQEPGSTSSYPDQMGTIAVFGSGIVGTAAAWDITRRGHTVVADTGAEAATTAGRIAGAAAVTLDATDDTAVRRLLDGKDTVVSAVPYALGMQVATAAVATATHYFDFGAIRRWSGASCSSTNPLATLVAVVPRLWTGAGHGGRRDQTFDALGGEPDRRGAPPRRRPPHSANRCARVPSGLQPRRPHQRIRGTR